MTKRLSWSQDGQDSKHGFKPAGGWRFGNTIYGAQAECLRVPDARAYLSPVPDGLTDEQVLMCPDIMSTGFAGAERANIQIGDTVFVIDGSDRILTGESGGIGHQSLQTG